VCEALKATDNEEERKVLGIMEKTFKCYITEDPKAKELKERLNNVECELAQATRTQLNLGFKVGEGSISDHVCEASLSSRPASSSLAASKSVAVHHQCCRTPRPMASSRRPAPCSCGT
jgi:hypothetical protein